MKDVHLRRLQAAAAAEAGAEEDGGGTEDGGHGVAEADDGADGPPTSPGGVATGVDDADGEDDGRGAPAETSSPSSRSRDRDRDGSGRRRSRSRSPSRASSTRSGHGHHQDGHGTRRRIKYWCSKCPQGFTSKRKLKRHMRHAHPPTPAEHRCGFCRKRFRHPSDVRRHEGHCPKKPIIPQLMDMKTLWDVISSCEISNRTAYKLLVQLKRKLGYRFFPPNLRKALSASLNCYMQQVTAEYVVGSNACALNTGTVLVCCEFLFIDQTFIPHSAHAYFSMRTFERHLLFCLLH